jgi:hypothetical protein
MITPPDYAMLHGRQSIAGEMIPLPDFRLKLEARLKRQA